MTHLTNVYFFLSGLSYSESYSCLEYRGSASRTNRRACLVRAALLRSHQYQQSTAVLRVCLTPTTGSTLCLPVCPINPRHLGLASQTQRQWPAASIILVKRSLASETPGYHAIAALSGGVVCAHFDTTCFHSTQARSPTRNVPRS